MVMFHSFGTHITSPNMSMDWFVGENLHRKPQIFPSGWWYTYPSEKYLSVGIIITNIWKNNIWKNNTCSKPPTSNVTIWNPTCASMRIYAHCLDNPG
jgi:hypothetical protein